MVKFSLQAAGFVETASFLILSIGFLQKSSQKYYKNINQREKRKN